MEGSMMGRTKLVQNCLVMPMYCPLFEPNPHFSSHKTAILSFVSLSNGQVG